MKSQQKIIFFAINQISF